MTPQCPGFRVKVGLKLGLPSTQESGLSSEVRKDSVPACFALFPKPILFTALTYTGLFHYAPSTSTAALDYFAPRAGHLATCHAPAAAASAATRGDLKRAGRAEAACCVSLPPMGAYGSDKDRTHGIPAARRTALALPQGQAAVQGRHLAGCLLQK